MATLVKLSKLERFHEALDDLATTATQHAHVINGQGEKLKAYGERYADLWQQHDTLVRQVAEFRETVLTRIKALEAAQRQADGLETA
jgi:hypothetical protein